MTHTNTTTLKNEGWFQHYFSGTRVVDTSNMSSPKVRLALVKNSDAHSYLIPKKNTFVLAQSYIYLYKIFRIFLMLETSLTKTINITFSNDELIRIHNNTKTNILVKNVLKR